MRTIETYSTYIKADFYKAEQAAFKLLRIGNVSTLPIRVKKFSKHLPNLKIKTFSWYAKNWNVSFESVCEFTESDEGCCWYDSYTNTYIIL